MIKVVTHSRKFHADELMAIVLLEQFAFNGEKYEIIRTRDEKKLKGYVNDPDVFVVDVGFNYNPEMKNFDHHQESFKLKWSNGITMSSCGIVWNYLKENKYLSQHMNAETIEKVEEELIQLIDAQDNGEGFWQEGVFLSMFNRHHHDDKVVDRQFKMALNAAKSFYINFFYHLRKRMKDEKQLKKDIVKSEQYENTVVFSSKLDNAMGYLADNTNKDWVVFPRTKNSWMIQAIPQSSKSLFSQRKGFPKDWRGLENDKLRKVSSVPHLKFCHKKGYMAIFEGELKEALWLTEGILKSEGVSNG